MRRDPSQPIGIGLMTALAGFTSSFTVVLAGLSRVGGKTAQAASAGQALNVAATTATRRRHWLTGSPSTATR